MNEKLYSSFVYKATLKTENKKDCLKLLLRQPLKIELRNAANAVGNLKESHLSHFFKRVAFQKGRAAIVATALKPGVFIYNMVTKKIVDKSTNDFIFLNQKES